MLQLPSRDGARARVYHPAAMLPPAAPRPTKSGGAALRAEIRLVRDLLDQVLAEQEGAAVARSVERLRARTR